MRGGTSRPLTFYTCRSGTCPEGRPPAACPWPRALGCVQVAGLFQDPDMPVSFMSPYQMKRELDGMHGAPYRVLLERLLSYNIRLHQTHPDIEAPPDPDAPDDAASDKDGGADVGGVLGVCSAPPQARGPSVGARAQAPPHADGRVRPAAASQAAPPPAQHHNYLPPPPPPPQSGRDMGGHVWVGRGVVGLDPAGIEGTQASP